MTEMLRQFTTLQAVTSSLIPLYKTLPFSIKLGRGTISSKRYGLLDGGVRVTPPVVR